MSSGISVSDGFSLASKETWPKDDGARFETGFLGTGVLTGDHWYSAYAAFRLYSPNFQTLEVKPFLQAADIGGQNVLQEGAHLNYLFNLGGVAKSHLGIGFGHDGPQVGSGIGSNNGFVRTANLIDLLGNATIDFSFRFDLSSVRPTMFSTIVGFQDRFGDVTFLGHYDKGVEPLTFQDVQEVTLGVRCQPEEEWALTLQYLHEQVATTPFEGARANIQVEKTGPTMIFKKVGMDVGVQALQDPFQSLVFDTSIRFRAVFFGPDRSSILGRVLSNEPLYWEMGESVEVAKDVRSFVTAVNLGDVPIALPDADRPIGRSIIGGIEASF
jgi:hypothetical protein